MTSCNMTPKEIVEYFFAHMREESLNEAKEKGHELTYESFINKTPSIMAKAFNNQAVEKVDAILNSPLAVEHGINLEMAIDLVMESFVDAVLQYMEMDDTDIANMIEEIVTDVLKDAGLSPDNFSVKAIPVDEDTYNKFNKSNPGRNAYLN